MKFWTCILLCALLLSGFCYAQDNIVEKQAKAAEFWELEQAVEDYIGEIDLSGGVDLNSGLSSVFENGSREMEGAVKRALRSGVLLISVILFCSLTDGMEALGTTSGFSPATLVGAVAVASVAVGDVHTLIGLGKEAIGQMETLSKVLIPAMAVATAASGAPAAAAAKQFATMLFSDLLLTVIHRLLLPLVYAYVAVCAANTALGNEGLKRISGMIKWVVTSILTLLLLAFVSYLGVSGAIAGTTDAAAIKAAKFALSGMVPVVGGILSDAAETVLVGAGILKNSVGVAGMLAVLFICITPFLQLGTHYLIYKLTAAMAATVSNNKVAGLVSSIGGAFGLILGMTGACALLLLISSVSAISMVVK